MKLASLVALWGVLFTFEGNNDRLREFPLINWILSPWSDGKQLMGMLILLGICSFSQHLLQNYAIHLAIKISYVMRVCDIGFSTAISHIYLYYRASICLSNISMKSLTYKVDSIKDDP